MENLLTLSQQELEKRLEEAQSSSKGSRFKRADRITAIKAELSRREKLIEEDQQRQQLLLYLIAAEETTPSELSQRFKKARHINPLFARAIMLQEAYRDLRAWEFRQQHLDSPITEELLNQFQEYLERPLPFQYSFRIGGKHFDPGILSQEP